MAGRTSENNVMRGWYRDGLEHIWMPYSQMKTAPAPLPVVSTRGSRIVLSDGRELIDGIASWWTGCHGYNHPHIRRAVEMQLATMPHVMLGGLVHEQALRLAGRLAGLLRGDLSRVFFSESGSVAIEVAMKMAVQYRINRGVVGKSQFVAFKAGYHGDTTGAMAVSDPEASMHTMFAGVLQKYRVVDLPENAATTTTLERLLAEHSSTIAGIIVEPLVQGAGGMKFHDTSVLRRLRTLADKFFKVTVSTEIYTGFGRTGSMFACDQAEVVPDIITLSKALTGGTLPLAATIATRQVFDAFWSDDPKKALMHGPTYTGNALACAAANASLDLFEKEPRLRQVTDISAAMASDLAACRDVPIVKDVRVRGAIGVIELNHVDDLDSLRTHFIEQGVFIRPIGNVIYLTPAFTISSDELKTLTDAVVKTVRQLNR